MDFIFFSLPGLLTSDGFEIHGGNFTQLSVLPFNLLPLAILRPSLLFDLYIHIYSLNDCKSLLPLYAYQSPFKNVNPKVDLCKAEQITAILKAVSFFKDTQGWKLSEH